MWSFWAVWYLDVCIRKGKVLVYDSISCFPKPQALFFSAARASRFWPSRRRVFVDRFCISQHDPQLKAEGLFSLGAILKSSDVTRWCRLSILGVSRNGGGGVRI